MSMQRDSAERRLLVITYHFPPDGAIGGQRWAGLSKYLARLGWEVHVVTASPLGQEEENPGVNRHVRHRRRTMNDFYKATIGRLRQAADTNGQTAPSNPGARRRSLLSTTFAHVHRI